MQFFFFFFWFFVGTRFRPLSFNTPKPLFPLAGQPMVHHPISACKRVSFFFNFLIALLIEKSNLYTPFDFFSTEKKPNGISIRIISLLLLN
jgi:NDP-sugar pyrophosphorylase family protein